jgi:hypothetical protein
MMSGVSPETCWASYKYGIIKCWHIVASCWIFLYKLYYGTRIHEHQVVVSIFISPANLKLHRHLPVIFPTKCLHLRTFDI